MRRKYFQHGGNGSQIRVVSFVYIGYCASFVYIIIYYIYIYIVYTLIYVGILCISNINNIIYPLFDPMKLDNDNYCVIYVLRNISNVKISCKI